MKKNKQWVLKEVKETINGFFDRSTEGVAKQYEDELIASIADIINQLDEPEVLSQEWIDDNKKDSGVHSIGYYVPIGRLHDLLVPKQEEITEEQAWKLLADKFDWAWSGLRANVINLVKALEGGLAMGEINDIAAGYKAVIEKPTIPQFVAEFIESCERKPLKSLFWVFTNIERGNEMLVPKAISDWIIEDDNDEVFAQAWLAYPNIEVEEEQKYRIELPNSEYGVVYIAKDVVTGEPITRVDVHNGDYVTDLTEDEIKKN